MALGTFDISTILDNSKRGKELSARLADVGRKWQEQIEAAERNLATARKHAAATTADSPAEVRFRSSHEVAEANRELDYLRQQQAADIEARRLHFRDLVAAELSPVLEQIATDRDLEAILALPNPAVAFVREQCDLTNELIRRMDNPN